MQTQRPLTKLSDDELLAGLDRLVRDSRRLETDLLEHIGEVDARRLYAREACASMFVYCTRVLHLSEAEAYLRITVARAARSQPRLLEMLGDGRLHLTGAGRLVRHLTADNRDSLLARATHRTRREIEELVADLEPRPDAASGLRKLPERSDGRPPVESSAVGAGGRGEVCLDRVAERPTEPGTRSLVKPVADSPPEPGMESEADARATAGTGCGEPSPAAQLQALCLPGPRPFPRPAVQPLGGARYRLQLTIGAELRDRIERLQALLRHRVPDGDLAAVIDVAVTRTLERLEARRFGKTRRPHGERHGEQHGKRHGHSAVPRSRHVPAAVRRLVYARDQGRCRYVDASGRRCPERQRLEFHHVRPFGMGGAHCASNVCLMCSTHNALLAERDYGGEKMAPYRFGSQGRSRLTAALPTSQELHALKGPPRCVPGRPGDA